jgi:hypothetical protein
MRKPGRWFTIALGLFCLSCTGLVDEGAAGPRGDARSLEGPVPATRFPRLTHLQWENTARDLLRLDGPTGVRDALREDPRRGGFLFDNDVERLDVDEALWQGYERAAAALAERVVSSPALLAAILPPAVAGEGDRARAERFVREFGRRAHRRPLEAADLVAYMDVYDAAAALDPDRPAFEAGIRLLIEAFLQSPYFLYRLELSGHAQGGTIPLDGYERASRLSYLLWNTMPDDALLDAAAAGTVNSEEGLLAEAERMLDDPRAEDTLLRFHALLLEVDKFASIAPSRAFFPDVPDHLAALALRENELFLRHVLGAYDGGWHDLLTLPETFVNADLARIYGLTGTYGDDFEHASLDASQRRGLFTQVGFLATNASSALPDPIHRGVFLAERISCIHIAAPPNDLPPLPAAEGRTNREVVESHTEQPGTPCASCHTGIINPYGFPFESFDAVGAWQTHDNGYPVDTSASPLIGTDTVAVRGALDLVDRMAEHRAVHECYIQHWVEYAFGRSSADGDRALVGRLGELSLDRASVRRVLAELVASPAFTTRSTEELP